jgi:hypothetical protein
VLREPLLHFAVLALLVFAAHHAVAASRPESATIVVEAQTQRELNALFAQRQARPPSADEAQKLVDAWVEDEALLREGLKLDLPSHDPVIRDHIIAHMRAQLQASVPARAVGDAELHAFYAAHSDTYQQPELVSLVEYTVPQGSGADDRARALWLLLQAHQPVTEVPTAVDDRSEAQLVTLYGEQLGKRMFALAGDQWQILRSAAALHIVKLSRRTPANQPAFDTLRQQVLLDLRNEQTQRLFRSALERTRASFEVRVESVDP